MHFSRQISGGNSYKDVIQKKDSKTITTDCMIPCIWQDAYLRKKNIEQENDRKRKIRGIANKINAAVRK